jgi:transcriptional regulator with XRE-family HTH domain
MEKPMNDTDLAKIGAAIKTSRKEKCWTLDRLATEAGVSKSLLSKVENARVVVSLPVFVRVARALDVRIRDIVKDIDRDDHPNYLLVRREDREVMDRDDSAGYDYEMLCSVGADCHHFQAVILTVQPGAERENLANNGDEMIFVVSGETDFVLGETSISLSAGDTLYFDGNIPHRPVNRHAAPVVMLVIYLLQR